MSTTTSMTYWKPLSENLEGPLVLRGDSSYDELRKVWNGMIDLHPAAIARCQSVADVQHAIAFGGDHGIELSIRGGGHSAAGLAMVENGLVIDLSEMNHVDVDPDAKTARAQGGATWAQFDRATTAHNLAITGGAISTTGIGGLTLGGGVGNLMRAYGLTCDSMISAEVVLANGDAVTAGADSHPDLFWALRGGGGNFGVVTEFTFNLHPVNGVFGGLIIHPRDNAKAVIQNYREAATVAPDKLGIFCGLMHSPDGHPIAGYVTWYNGSEDEAAGPMTQLRSFGPPLADMTAFVPYTAAQSALDEGFPPGIHNYWKSHFLSGLPDEAIEIIVEHANAAPSPLSATLLEAMGGAVARVPADATAFAHRDAPFNLAIISRWLDPAGANANIAWARGFFDAMQPYATGVYMNYLGIGDDPARIADAYGSETYQRLREVKRQYDPENLFHRNQNIPPA